jgi:voltage-gated potassium channel Kch
MSGMWNSFFPGTFNFRSDFTQNFSNEIYFSVVTMTTLGYGDLLPLTNSGKSWSVLMAITGSFYSTVVLALIVGKFIASKDR